MQAAAVGVEEGHDLDGRDLCVEGLGVFEIVVPDLIDHVPTIVFETSAAGTSKHYVFLLILLLSCFRSSNKQMKP